MIVKSIRQLAPFVGKSFSMLSRDFRKGKFREEPGGGFDVDKVKAALARSTDPAQPPRRPAGRDTAIHDEIGMSGTAYEIFNRARLASALTVAKERQLNLKKRQGELLEVIEGKYDGHAAAPQNGKGVHRGFTGFTQT